MRIRDAYNVEHRNEKFLKLCLNTSKCFCHYCFVYTRNTHEKQVRQRKSESKRARKRENNHILIVYIVSVHLICEQRVYVSNTKRAIFIYTCFKYFNGHEQNKCVRSFFFCSDERNKKLKKIMRRNNEIGWFGIVSIFGFESLHSDRNHP